MSTRMRSSRNSICVSGFGSPADTNKSRTLLSCGDSAPPSVNFSAARSRRMPRAPVPVCQSEDLYRFDTGRIAKRIENRYGLRDGPAAYSPSVGAVHGFRGVDVLIPHARRTKKPGLREASRAFSLRT